MSNKQLTFTSNLLLYLSTLEDALTPWLSPYEFRKRLMYGKNEKSYQSTMYKFQRRGWIKLVNKNTKKFIKLTNKGQLEALLRKAILPQKQIWDGK